MHASSSKRSSRLLEETSFIRFYLWKYKRWISFGLLALVVVDLIDVIPPILLKNVVDVTIAKGPVSQLLQLALGYFSISLVQGICRYGWRMYLVRSSVLAGRDLRGRFVEHLFRLSVSFFDRHRMGDLMSLAISDVDSVRMAIGSGLLVFADAIFFLVTIPIAMWFLSPQLTLLVCLPLPLIPLIVLRNERAIHERFQKVQSSFGKISAMTQESLNGIRVIKSFAQEDTQIQRLKELGEEFIQLNMRLSRVQTTTGPALDLVMSIGMVTLLFWGGGLMIHDGTSALTLGTFVAFQRYLQKLIWPMAALGMAINYFQKAISSSNRLKEVLTVLPEVVESPNPVFPHLIRGKTPGGVEFKNLNFRFPATFEPALREISLKIEPGERIAFVGTIGSGKSALLSLIPRLYPIQKGMLAIDGVDVNDWPIEELRHQVGYVSQEVFLFSESIMENIAFGLHEWIEKDLVEEVARLASIHQEIQSLDSAYGTPLGDRGLSLSGGQKQRLTLARALAKKPSILVLDDALSSVDLHTEAKILSSLRDRSERNTELVAAHRISTIRDADRIVVLRDGKIQQMGTHSRLCAQKGGEYWKFFEQQKLREELESYENEFSECF